MTEREVIAEVREMISEALAAGQQPEAQRLVHGLLERHNKIEGEDKDFHTLAAYHFGQRIVKLALRRGRATPEGDDDEPRPFGQMVLPGYEYLQEAYLVARDGLQRLVAVQDMTDEELDSKAEEHRRLSKGNEQHAEELIRYKAERKRPTSAA